MNAKKLTSAILMIGSPNVYADILHVTGFKSSDAVVCLRHGRRTYMAVPRMEIGRARETCPGLVCLTPEALALSPVERRKLSGWAYGLMRQAGVREALVPAVFPVGAARALEKKGLRLRVAKTALCPDRLVKTPAEIEKIRAAQVAAVNAMRQAMAAIERARVDGRGQLRDGAALLTAESLRRLINRVLMDHDCAGGEPIVACGPKSSHPHWIGEGPLMAGQPIVMDIFPRHVGTGFWGDLTRTVAKGHASPALVRMHRAVKRAQEQALATIRAGVRGSTIHEGVRSVFRQMGFADRVTGDGVPEGFIHGTGHGVGLEIHEAPGVSTGSGPLRAGHVVTVEPGLYYTDIGGIRIEDTVAVTRGGCEILAACPKGLIIP